MKKKLFKYRWVLAWFAGFIVALTVSYIIFNEDLTSAYHSTLGGSIGGGIAVFFIYFFEKKKMQKAEKVQGSDTTMMP